MWKKEGQQCRARTRSGGQCRNDAIPGKRFCFIKAHGANAGLGQRFVNMFQNHWVGVSVGLLLALSSAIIVPLLTVAEPAIYATSRTVPDPPTIVAVPTEGPLQILAVSIKDRFKNFSFLKEGFIDRVETTPTSFEAMPKVEVIFIDKEPLRPRMEKEIEMRFLVAIDPRKSADLFKRTGKMTSFSLRAFDNRGRLIPSVMGGPYFNELKIEITAKSN